jgi:hypothetical protein
MVKVKLKRNKQPCKWWKSCSDYKRSKEICHDGEEVYCMTNWRLNKKDGKKV